MKLNSIEWIAYTASVWSFHVAVSSNLSQFYIENEEISFLSFAGFFSSTIEMNGSKQHPMVPFTLSARFKDFVLTLVICHTTLPLSP